MMQSLKRIRFRLLHSQKVQKILYRIGGVELFSHLLAASVKLTNIRPDTPTVLCVYRNLFSKDIEQLRVRTDMNWITVRTGFLGRLQSVWVPAPMRQQTAYVNYTGGEFTVARERSTELAFKFLRKLSHRQKIDAVMSANIDYWQDDGLRRACSKLGLPFLALSREHYTMPYVEARAIDYYQNLGYNYEGAGVAVFGPTTREVLIKAGACHETQIWITGAPRLDKWRDIDGAEIKQDTYTLLSYAATGYLAPKNFQEVLKLFAKFSATRTNTKTKFVVKCKNVIDKNNIKQMLASPPHHQLVLDADVSLHKLLPSSRLIIGFNSLALLEGLFTNAILAVPNWADAGQNPRSKLMIDPNDAEMASVFTFIDSANQLEKLMDKYINTPLPPANKEKRMKILQHYFHFPQEKSCSACVADFIRYYISEHDNSSSP